MNVLKTKRRQNRILRDQDFLSLLKPTSHKKDRDWLGRQQSTDVDWLGRKPKKKRDWLGRG